ncbi:MAG: alkaline phosphatase family protein [Myxococcaceae bacterium]
MSNQVLQTSVHDWAKGAISRIGKNVNRVETRRPRKLVLIHLDGVPRKLLDDAVRTGKMPFLSSLVQSGAYHLDSAFWGSPASTPCFQAGALYGLRHANLPAYHWYDRALVKEIHMNVPKDALLVEQHLKVRPENSLLEGGGTSYLSLFRADATNRMCMSALADMKVAAKAIVKDLKGVRGPKRQPVWRFIRELVRDTWRTGLDVFRWGRRLKDFRHEREYVANRFFMMLGWELAHSRTLIDMVRGVPAIYLVFGNFDEVAHRRGPLSEQAISTLFQADAAFEELYTFSKALDEPYDIVFITDHGHVDSAPFEKNTGLRLKKYLLEGASMPLSGELENALRDGRTAEKRERVALSSSPETGPVVVEAGNFSHVYLTRDTRALEAMDFIESPTYRDVLARAAASPQIGIVALRRGDSAVGIIRGRAYGPDEITSAPLSSGFSKRAVADLLRELPHMPTAGDLVLYGEVTHAAGTVGFAWEFGSHGGLTTVETDSVVLWPSDAPLDLRGLSHCSQLYDKLSEVYRN